MSYYRRKLIEVALPLESISSAAEDENNTHVGGISNLHIWWSRKPLTTARGILFASLVDDPSVFLNDDEAIIAERERLFTLLEDLVAWKNTNNEEVLDKARLEVARCVARNLNVDLPVGKLAIRQFLVENAPCILDPFAGGGSIPLEGQRLGLKVHASDLNPVAVLINKALIEIPPKFVSIPPVHPSEQINKAGQNTNQPTLLERDWRRNEGLADDIRYYGKWMFEEANKRIGFLYSPVKITPELLRERPDLKAQKIKPGDELPVIAWIWTRTVKCPNPACEIQAPLVNKFWVSTHNGNEAWINSTLRDGSKAFEFDVVVGRGQPQEGTVKRSGAYCLACKTPIPFTYIRQQGIDGRIDFQLMCLVADGSSKRVYIPPRCAQTAVSLENLHPEWLPETTLPGKALGFRVQKYGITKHQDFFTKRQLVALSTFCELLAEVEKEILRDSKGDLEYAEAIITYLSLAINRLAQTNNSLIRWLIRKSGTSKGTPAFDRPIVPMAWEFSEGNVFLDSVGSWNSAIKNMLSAFSVFVPNQTPGQAFQASASDAIKITLPVVSTDPPYFDNIGYGDLSDFFYIWLRKNLNRIYPELFATMLVPKHQEIVMAPDRFDGDANDAEKHFMEGLKSAFKLICNGANPDYPVTFYYAFKQAEEIEDNLGILGFTPKSGQVVKENAGHWPRTGWAKDSPGSSVA